MTWQLAYLVVAVPLSHASSSPQKATAAVDDLTVIASSWHNTQPTRGMRDRCWPHVECLCAVLQLVVAAAVLVSNVIRSAQHGR
ncbi:uncharacterized protein B0I36DRAFT_309731 [Microdochium trichocladiopsis]|uniref:Secreted protein n=1 Tax=Microdochium trichocladiopsis TaxID=1682393 RepID=A0A9P9BVQ5_9PEZI|nr:uncharacterized protein B0I36DRAFT_309731 [Microdochium trichocladiopsis]KAH7039987.1 hypothetical protein B0I36DRAFT_309731 [Microdochium trichocladiopsis]